MAFFNVEWISQWLAFLDRDFGLVLFGIPIQNWMWFVPLMTFCAFHIIMWIIHRR